MLIIIFAYIQYSLMGLLLNLLLIDIFCQQKSVTSLAPVVSTDLNKGFTNVYHILSHIQGISDSYNNSDYAVPTQTILLNNKKYLLSRFAFEIKE